MQAPSRKDIIGQNVDLTRYRPLLCRTLYFFFNCNLPSVSDTLKRKHRINRSVRNSMIKIKLLNPKRNNT